MKIAIADIAPDPNQPRKLFDVADLEILAGSLKANGQLQDITVRAADEEGKWWVCYGERRWRAHCLLRDRGHAKFAYINAQISADIPEADLRVRQIVENVARADFRPLEEAQAYKGLLEHMTAEEAARRLGIPSARFQARLSLLGLEEGIAKLLAGGQLDAAQATEIARLPSQADQLKILRMINRGEIGKWKSLKAAIDALLGETKAADLFGPGAPAATNEEVVALNAMERRVAALAQGLSGGWKEGQCVIANKVSPDRAARMADQLAAIRQSVRLMEQQLRNTHAQAMALQV